MTFRRAESVSLGIRNTSRRLAQDGRAQLGSRPVAARDEIVGVGQRLDAANIGRLEILDRGRLSSISEAIAIDLAYPRA